jgi:hypothetical protein
MALQISQFLVVRCNSGVDALATAQFRYRALTSEAIQNNADLLLSGELTASVAADILDRLFGV